MSWRVARSLDTLLAEVNTAAPNRSKISDGSIGDPAHSSRVSDHNPNSAGVVRARDITHDPAGGLDCNDLAASLTRLLGKHPALGSGAYLIWNERIVSTDRLSEGWRYYGNWSTGLNPHDHHIHVSVQTAAPGYDSTAAWLKEEDDMPYTPEELTAIVEKAIDRKLSDIGEERIVNPGEDGPGSRSLNSILWALLRAQRNTNELLRGLTSKGQRRS